MQPEQVEAVADLGHPSGVIIGGRLGYVLFYQPGYYLQNPADPIGAAVWDGGMSFHGGFHGCDRRGADLLPARKGMPALQRWAMLMAYALRRGCCSGAWPISSMPSFGAALNLPWGVIFPGEAAQYLPWHHRCLRPPPEPALRGRAGRADPWLQCSYFLRLEARAALKLSGPGSWGLFMCRLRPRRASCRRIRAPGGLSVRDPMTIPLGLA
jgi:hypothetical protein